LKHTNALITIALLAVALSLTGCGGGNNQSSANVSSFAGTYNVVTTVNGATAYMFGMTLNQSGTIINGSYATPTGGIASSSCFDPSSILVQGNASGNNVSLIIKDRNAAEIDITATKQGSAINGTFHEPSNTIGSHSMVFCQAMDGTVAITPQ
jgi:hypothetical protein